MIFKVVVLSADMTAAAVPVIVQAGVVNAGVAAKVTVQATPVAPITILPLELLPTIVGEVPHVARVGTAWQVPVPEPVQQKYGAPEEVQEELEAYEVCPLI